MNSLLRSTLTISVLLHGVALAQAWPTPPYVPPLVKPQRACSSSSFTLEVPLGAAALPTSFDAAFTFWAEPRWFGLSGGLIQPKLTAVLPNYSTSNVVARRDGHRRSFVVSFVRLQAGFPSTWVAAPPVLEEFGCEALNAIRDAAARAQSITIAEGMIRQAPLLISRSCDVVVQDAEAHAAPETTRWQATRIAAQPASWLPQVDVALIDTGVDPLYRTQLGVVAENALPAFERVSRTEYHPHGAQMAALIHAVAPNAVIRSYRALDGRGMGSLQSVARAVDDAIFDPAIAGTTRKPLVVNLSVGARPDLTGPTTLEVTHLDGTSCKSWDDGAGETLRYVLYVAGQLEQLPQQQGVVIVASGGNTPLEFMSTSNELETGLAATSCGGVNARLPVRASSFIPAAFGESPVCRGGKVWLPVLPVGATRWDDRRSDVTRLQAEPRVYAPGERVYAVNSAFPPSGAEPACGSADVGYAHALETPGPVTGTSASAALTSAAAAHLIGERLWGPTGSGWRSADMARLLYLTGRKLCSSAGERGIGSRIDITRAKRGLGCPALLSCLRSSAHPVGPMVGASTATVCASAMDTCFGADAETSCPKGVDEEPGWGTYGDSFVPGGICMASWKAPLGRQVPSPGAHFPDVQLSGLGPQPSQSGCPNCALVVWSDPSIPVELVYELTDAFPAATPIRDAWVTVLDESKRVMTTVPVSDGRIWYPGEVGDLKVDLRISSEELYGRLRSREWTAVLDVGVTDRDARAARLVSPLRLVFR